MIQRTPPVDIAEVTFIRGIIEEVKTGDQNSGPLRERLDYLRVLMKSAMDLA